MTPHDKMAPYGTSGQEAFTAERLPGQTDPTHGSGQAPGQLSADNVIVDPIPPKTNPFTSLAGHGGTGQPPKPIPPLSAPALPGLEPLPGYFPPEALESGEESGDDDDFRPMPADCQAATPEQEEFTLFLRAATQAPTLPNDQHSGLEKGGKFWKKVRKGAKKFFGGVAKFFGGSGFGSGRLIGAVASGIAGAIPERGTYEVVIGPDDRMPILDTTVAPFSGCTQLDITSPSGREYVGSASCIARTGRFSIFLTAAHCVYFHDAGGMASTIKVSPGRSVDDFPFGSAHFRLNVDIGAIFVPDAWIESRARSADWALVIVEDTFETADGRYPHVFDVKAFEDHELGNQVGQVSGYPVDMTNAMMDSTRQYFHADEVAAVEEGRIVYRLDTTGGQSGSPFWFHDSTNGTRIIAGVHTMGDSSGNSATRITPEIVAKIQEWIAVAEAA